MEKRKRDYFAEDYGDVSDDGYVVCVEDLMASTGGFYGPYKTYQESIAKFNDLYESAKSNGHEVEIVDGGFTVDGEVRIFPSPGFGAMYDYDKFVHGDFA